MTRLRFWFYLPPTLPSRRQSNAPTRGRGGKPDGTANVAGHAGGVAGRHVMGLLLESTLPLPKVPAAQKKTREQHFSAPPPTATLAPLPPLLCSDLWFWHA